MAVIPLPDGAKFKSVEWKLLQPSQGFRSPYDGKQHIVELGAPGWSCSVTVIPITREAAIKPWRAFLAALRGRYNTFRMPAPNIIPASDPGYSWLVNSGQAPAGSAQFTGHGYVAGQTIVKAGSFMKAPLDGGGAQLLTVTEDAVVSGAGEVVVKFAPALRGSVTAAPWWLATTADPNSGTVCEMALVEDSFTIRGTEGQGFSVSFDALEAF